MSQIPVSPRFAVMIVTAVAKSRSASSDLVRFGLVPACAALVAGWSVGQLVELQEGDTDKSTMSLPHRQYDSDVDAVLWMLSSFMGEERR